LIKNVQRKLIRECKEAVEQNPDLVRIDRWDLSKIFYYTRTILDHDGYDTSLMNKPEKRNDIINTESIVHYCLQRFYTVVIIIGKLKIREEGCV